jgi:DNA modification methylase
LIGVYRVGKGKHLNNIELGSNGRSRTNVWHYAGVNTFRAGRMTDLKSHPSVKPIAMVCDALRDCTRRGDPVLDSFAGSGTTLLAAERLGRKAICVDIEPRYVDLMVRRWQEFTGRDALHRATGLTFNELAAEQHQKQEKAA